MKDLQTKVTGQVHVLRAGHIEEDAGQMNIGDPFVISTRGKAGKNPEFLYEKGRGYNIWGESFRVIGLMGFVDCIGVSKIGISAYGDKGRKMHWDCRAEEFPVRDTGLYGLNKTGELLPYYTFLKEHGVDMLQLMHQHETESSRESAPSV